jgi:hypothetical protein
MQKCYCKVHLVLNPPGISATFLVSKSYVQLHITVKTLMLSLCGEKGKVNIVDPIGQRIYYCPYLL